MAGLTVAAFYADPVGRESRFSEYVSYGIAARKALALTNPAARFVILSDWATGAKFKSEGFYVETCADSSLPLMLQIVDAQRCFVEYLWDGEGLLVLPDIDAMANRALDDAIPDDCGLAITHKGSKFDYRINNLAYIRNRVLATWFLSRAFEILKTFPADQLDWGGDQEAWGAACGIPFGSNGSAGYWVPIERKHETAEIFLALPHRNRPVWLYPCATHNDTITQSDIGQELDPYFVHFKGERKSMLRVWAKKRFGKDFWQ